MAPALTTMKGLYLRYIEGQHSVNPSPRRELTIKRRNNVATTPQRQRSDLIIPGHKNRPKKNKRRPLNYNRTLPPASPHPHQRPSAHTRTVHPIFTFFDLLHNAAFLLSHITNQGIHELISGKL